MVEFFQLSAEERLDALNAAADTSGLLPHLLEKDIWVVWSLQHLFTGPYAEHFVFKGGTSLSKGYGIIRRFSEDVDLTYDIRAIAGDLVGDANEPLPASKSQEKKWSKEIRARLSSWVVTEIAPRLKQDLARHGLPATARAEGGKLFSQCLTGDVGFGGNQRNRLKPRQPGPCNSSSGRFPPASRNALNPRSSIVSTQRVPI